VRTTLGRVTLRPLRRADFPEIEPWYDSALALAYAERDLETRFADAAAAKCGLLAIADRDGAIAGILDYRLDKPGDGWLTVVYIGIADGRRGFGYGSEAVRALETWAGRTQQVTTFLADVSDRNGLGLYFWLRAGYHPANVNEVFWRPPNEGGIIAMIRSI
jgi:RimJ/RimL family protein N-acetyltransferase